MTFEFKEGKRVRPNGSILAAGMAVKDAFGILAITKNGSRFAFTTEETPIDERKSTGINVVPLMKGDTLLVLNRLPVLQS